MRSVGEACWRRELEKRFAKKCCRGVVGKSFVKKCV